MQGISAKDHQLIMDVFSKFEQMAIVAKEKISVEEEAKTREGITELRKIYSDFQYMLQELQQCAKHYEMRRKAVQSQLNRNIRQLNPEVQKRRRYMK